MVNDTVAEDDDDSREDNASFTKELPRVVPEQLVRGHHQGEDKAETDDQGESEPAGNRLVVAQEGHGIDSREDPGFDKETARTGGGEVTFETTFEHRREAQAANLSRLETSELFLYEEAE